jgi:RNA polymerase sigma-70 factor (ECF subfamily)
MSAVRHLSIVNAGWEAAQPADRRATMLPMPDAAADALERAARGSESAFAEFYDHAAPIVYGTVLRVVRDPSIAEEVTQEVFVELWRQAARFESAKGSPMSWAATIAHRRAVDRVRSEQASRRRDDADAQRVVVVHDVVVDEVVASLEHNRVRAALAQLTDPQREAVELAYFGGNTYREVAALLDVPEGTIKTRIRDGMIKLRDLMGVPA